MRLAQLRRACALLVAAVAVCALAGCAFLGEPASTEDLLVRFAAHPDCGNYTMEGSADLVVKAAGFRTRIPVGVSGSAAATTARGTVDVDLSSVGGSRHSYMGYVEQQGPSVVAYVTRPNDAPGAWSRAEITLPTKIDVATVVRVLSEAKFMRVAYDSDDQVAYELSIPAASALRAFVGSGQISASFADVDVDQIVDLLGDGELRVRFDRECRPRSVAFDLEFSVPAGDGVPVPVKANLNVALAFSGHGSVTDAEVSAPAKVVDSAKLTDDPFAVEALVREVTPGS